MNPFFFSQSEVSKMRKTTLVTCITVAGIAFAGSSEAADRVNYVCQGGSQLVIEYAPDGKSALIVSDAGRQGLSNTALTAQPAESGMLFVGQPPVVVNDPRFQTNGFSPVQLEFSLVKVTGETRDKIGVRQGRRFFECNASGPSK